jgi:hypothetical protein
MALTYPESPTEEQQRNMKEYLNGMAHHLPCPGCAHHCRQYFNDNPPDVSSSQALSKYLVEFHNCVNERLGKKTYTEKEARQALLEKVANSEYLQSLSRADQTRREDSAFMKSLQDKLAKASAQPNLSYIPWCFAGMGLLLFVSFGISIYSARRRKKTQVQ